MSAPDSYSIVVTYGMYPRQVYAVAPTYADAVELRKVALRHKYRDATIVPTPDIRQARQAERRGEADPRRNHCRAA